MSLELRPDLAPRLLRRVRAAAKRVIVEAIDDGASVITVRQVAPVANEAARLEVLTDGASSVVVVGGDP